jgi:hypothetical protein
MLLYLIFKVFSEKIDFQLGIYRVSLKRNRYLVAYLKKSLLLFLG